MVRSWVREILALPKESHVQVHERKDGDVAIVVARDGQRTTHVIAAPLDTITWAQTAQVLLHLGKSCSEPD